MTEWNAKMSEAPEDVEVLVCYSDGSQSVTWGNATSSTAIAWKPLPEPYQEPCPVQWKASKLYHANKNDDLSNIIRTVERRTLEIVKWHLKNFGVEGLLAYCDGKGPKND